MRPDPKSNRIRMINPIIVLKSGVFTGMAAKLEMNESE
jgi:hypothetical protein